MSPARPEAFYIAGLCSWATGCGPHLIPDVPRSILKCPNANSGQMCYYAHRGGMPVPVLGGHGHEVFVTLRCESGRRYPVD
jgi:hypothetical protein